MRFNIRSKWFKLPSLYLIRKSIPVNWKIRFGARPQHYLNMARPHHSYMHFATALFMFSNPMSFSINSFTFFSSALSDASAFSTSIAAKLSFTVTMLPLSIAFLRLKVWLVGMIISIGMFSVVATYCSKTPAPKHNHQRCQLPHSTNLHQTRVKYLGVCHVSSIAIIIPIPLSRALKTFSRLSALQSSLYWLLSPAIILMSGLETITCRRIANKTRAGRG